ncbi:hypothetical protein JCM8097_001650 [Rhodosporidiobolus ruineniae]
MSPSQQILDQLIDQGARGAALFKDRQLVAQSGAFEAGPEQLAIYGTTEVFAVAEYTDDAQEGLLEMGLSFAVERA